VVGYVKINGVSKSQINNENHKIVRCSLINPAIEQITPKTINIVGPHYCYLATNHNIDVLKHILSLKENDSNISSVLFDVLSRATHNGDIKLAKFILDYAANNNYALLENKRLQISPDYPSMQKLLLTYGAQCDTIVNNEKLRHAIQYGSINTVLFLIKQGVSLATHPGTQSLLYFVINSYMAEEHNRMSVLQILLNKGMDVNEKSGTDNNTPLGVAIFYYRTEVIQLLLAQPDIDVNAKNNNSKTPLDIAIEKLNNATNSTYLPAKQEIDKYNSIIQLLTEHGGKTSDQLAQENEDK